MKKRINKKRIPRLLLVLFVLTILIIISVFVFNNIRQDEYTSNEYDSGIGNDEDDQEQTQPLYDEELKEPEQDDLETEKLTENNLLDEDQGVDEDQVEKIIEEIADLKVISDGNYILALVTKETKIKSDYEPADLIEIPGYMSINPDRSFQLREVAMEPLKALWHNAKREGVILRVRSAYRSYQTQEQLFNDYAGRHGEEEANRFSARPGQSEHQLGTTVDFGGTEVDLTANFADTAQGEWLSENAHYFGFALSYPEGKEHITGYFFEPWHYRFIGVDEAVEWKESGLILSEYLKGKDQSFINSD